MRIESVHASAQVDAPSRGRPLVFDEVYDLYFPRVYNYIWYRVRDRAAADEIVSAVFEKVFRSFHLYDPVRGSLAACGTCARAMSPGSSTGPCAG